MNDAVIGDAALAAAVFEAAAVGLVVVDRTGAVVRMNRAAGEVLGIEPGAAEGRLFWELSPPNPDLEVIPSDLNGVESGARVLALRDRSVWRRAAENLTLARKMESLGEMAGDIAHQFNNHLTGASGFAQMALMKKDDSERVALCLEEIIAATNAGAQQTARIMIFGKNRNLEVRPSAIGAHVATAEGMLRPVVGNEVGLVVDVSDTQTLVMVAPGPLTELLLNLVENSADAIGLADPSPASTDQPHRITVSLHRVELGDRELAVYPGAEPGPYLALSVSDTGIGMSEETRLRMFDPLFTTADADTDAGLGLPLVYSIVHRADGMIDVVTSPGEGTTVTAYFPVVAGSFEE